MDLVVQWSRDEMDEIHKAADAAAVRLIMKRLAAMKRLATAADPAPEPAPEPSGEKPDPARPLSDVLPAYTGAITGAFGGPYNVQFGPANGESLEKSVTINGKNAYPLAVFVAQMIPLALALRSIVEGATPGASVTGEARSELVKLLCRAGVPVKV